MKKCLTCNYCRVRTSKKKRRTVYSCNEAGMMAVSTELLPEDCDRYREKKEVQS